MRIANFAQCKREQLDRFVDHMAYSDMPVELDAVDMPYETWQEQLDAYMELESRGRDFG